MLTFVEIKVFSLPISLSRDALNLFREVALTVFADIAPHVRETLFVKNVVRGVQLRVSFRVQFDGMSTLPFQHWM